MRTISKRRRAQCSRRGSKLRLLKTHSDPIPARSEIGLNVGLDRGHRPSRHGGVTNCGCQRYRVDQPLQRQVCFDSGQLFDLCPQDQVLRFEIESSLPQRRQRRSLQNLSVCLGAGCQPFESAIGGLRLTEIIGEERHGVSLSLYP